MKLKNYSIAHWQLRSNYLRNNNLKIEESVWMYIELKDSKTGNFMHCFFHSNRSEK